MGLFNKLSDFFRIKDIFSVLLGVFSASIGLKGFLLPNGFYDGGITGISLLLNHYLNIELSILILFLNIPFILIGNFIVSRKFAIKSTIAILFLSILVHWIEIPSITSDKLLISIFGGVFLGIGIGLSIRGGAVIDGTEVLAVQISRKTSLSVGDFIAIFNFILFSIVATVINIEAAMYSMLTYFSASKSVDFIISGIEEYIGVTIISKKYPKIQNTLVKQLNRGVTVYKTEGGYGKGGHDIEERKALFSVVTRLEVTTIVAAVRTIDPEAFIIQHSIKDTHGGMVKRRPLH